MSNGVRKESGMRKEGNMGERIRKESSMSKAGRSMSQKVRKELLCGRKCPGIRKKSKSGICVWR